MLCSWRQGPGETEESCSQGVGTPEWGPHSGWAETKQAWKTLLLLVFNKKKKKEKKLDKTGNHSCSPGRKLVCLHLSQIRMLWP